MRFLATVLSLALWIGGCHRGSSYVPPADGSLPIDARPVLLNAGNTKETRVGRLRYRGGLELTSPDSRFGGLSGMVVSANGAEFVAVSDEGFLIQGRLVYDFNGDLVGVVEARIQTLRGPNGKPLEGKSWRDAEALARTPDGDLVIAFEGEHRLWRYPKNGGTPEALPPPADLSRAPPNEGIEALALLADDRFLALTEGLKTEGGLVGWIGGKSGWSTLVCAVDQGFRPSDAATLPNGDVLVLERRFPPLGVRLRRLRAETIAPGAVLTGEEVARFEGPLTFDNMEGLAVRQGARGETLIDLVSDDNFNRPFQRTLLMMFELVDPPNPTP